MRIAVKYCGSCNPEVDLSRIGNLIVEQAQGLGWEVVPVARVTGADVLVLLCGCPRACIDTEELDQKAKRIVVAGKRMGWQPVTEEELPSAVVQSIKELSWQ